MIIASAAIVSWHTAVTDTSKLPPEVSTKISAAVQIKLLGGACWSVQHRSKGSWSNIGYHGSFYQAANWLLRSRPDLLAPGQLSHLDSLLRAYDVALGLLRVMAEPLSVENRELRVRVTQLEAINAKLQAQLGPAGEEADCNAAAKSSVQPPGIAPPDTV